MGKQRAGGGDKVTIGPCWIKRKAPLQRFVDKDIKKQDLVLRMEKKGYSGD